MEPIKTREGFYQRVELLTNEMTTKNALTIGSKALQLYEEYQTEAWLTNPSREEKALASRLQKKLRFKGAKLGRSVANRIHNMIHPIPLPREILYMIFSFLKIRDFGALRQTSCGLKKLVDDFEYTLINGKNLKALGIGNLESLSKLSLIPQMKVIDLRGYAPISLSDLMKLHQQFTDKKLFLPPVKFFSDDDFQQLADFENNVFKDKVIWGDLTNYDPEIETLEQRVGSLFPRLKWFKVRVRTFSRFKEFASKLKHRVYHLELEGIFVTQEQCLIAALDKKHGNHNFSELRTLVFRDSNVKEIPVNFHSKLQKVAFINCSNAQIARKSLLNRGFKGSIYIISQKNTLK